MLGINSSTCRTEKCMGAELRSKVNFLNEIEIAADGLQGLSYFLFMLVGV